MKQILVVDDESAILTLIEYNLKQAGFQVTLASDGREAYRKILKETFDLIVLDVMLPGMDGVELCRTVRKEGVETPIILLTAKSEEYDKVIGLELGADDYMTKPFSPRELIARIKAILRRSDTTRKHKETAMNDSNNDIENSEDNIIQAGDITIYEDRYEVQVRSDWVELTPKEFELLVYLAKRQGRILSREQLLSNIWQFDYAGESRIVDVHISHLREKIEQDSKHPEYIKTVRGFGYKFEVPSV